MRLRSLVYLYYGLSCQAKANENITNPETLSENEDVNQTNATTRTKTILSTSKNREVFCPPFPIAENQSEKIKNFKYQRADLHNNISSRIFTCLLDPVNMKRVAILLSFMPEGTPDPFYMRG